MPEYEFGARCRQGKALVAEQDGSGFPMVVTLLGWSMVLNATNVPHPGAEPVDRIERFRLG